jgi:hypothetical protein
MPHQDSALMYLTVMYHKYFQLTEIAAQKGVPPDVINLGLKSYEAMLVEVRDLIYLWIEQEKAYQERDKGLFDE